MTLLPAGVRVMKKLSDPITLGMDVGQASLTDWVKNNFHLFCSLYYHILRWYEKAPSVA